MSDLQKGGKWDVRKKEENGMFDLKKPRMSDLKYEENNNLKP